MTSLRRIAWQQNNGSDNPQRLLILFVVGFFIVLLGIVILMIAATLSNGSSASFGGVIFIGPIPIVIGVGPQAQWLILFAIILAVLSIIMFMIIRKRTNTEFS